MPYINYIEYSKMYGVDAILEDDFDLIEPLAEDIIDSLTRHAIKQGGGLSAFPVFIQELIIKATAAEVSYINLYGMDVFFTGLADQGFTVGKVSVSGSGGESRSSHSAVSPAVIMYLEQTGLLERSVQACSAPSLAGFYPIV